MADFIAEVGLEISSLSVWILICIFSRVHAECENLPRCDAF